MSADRSNLDLKNVVTKTGNNQKPPQATTNYKKTTTSNHKRPQTTSNQPKTTTNHQHTTTNYQQTNTNYQQTTKNWKSNVLFLLPTPDNYKDHPDFEKHSLQCQISVYLVGEGGFQLVGPGPTKVSSINTLRDLNERRFQRKYINMYNKYT